MEDFWTNTTHLQRTKNCLGIRGHCVVCFMQLCLVQTLSRISGFIGYELDGSTPFSLQICGTSMIEFYAVLLCCIVFYCVYLSSPCFQFSLAWVCPRQTNSDAMCSPKSFHQKAPVLPGEKWGLSAGGAWAALLNTALALKTYFASSVTSSMTS